MMITFEGLKNIPLSQLLTYRDALEALASKFEKDVLPMFGMATQYDRQTPQQIQSREKLSKVNSYLGVVYSAIEYVTFNELDNVNTPQKELLTEETNVPKKRKTNVKKINKKD